jgi:salicylate hydroxylase
MVIVLIKDPSVQKLLDISLPRIVNYPVHAVPPLSSWTHSSGRFTLVGDAAHAMAFYLSMGVSLAVEDAVSLAKVLDLAFPTSCAAPKANQLKAALSVFEEVRKRRATAVQKASLRGGNSYHVPAGKERDILHKVMSNPNEIVEVCAAGLGDGAEIHDEISCAVGGMMNRRTRDWCYGYDAVGEIIAVWNSKAR